MKARVIIELPNDFLEEIKKYANITTLEEMKGFLVCSWLNGIKESEYEGINISVEVKE